MATGPKNDLMSCARTIKRERAARRLEAAKSILA
jgi:hypothetical protein